MSCPVCHQLQCECRSSTGGLFAGFSLVGGDYPGGSNIGNPESSFIVECPPGIICAEGQYPVVVSLGENEIEFPYPINPPQGFPITLRLPCNGSEIVRTFPPGTTTLELNLAAALMLAECGQQRANKKVWGGVEFLTDVGNDAVTIDCPDDQQMRVASAWSGFEGVTAAGTSLQVAAGLFSVSVGPFTGEATTMEDAKTLANQRAQAYGKTAFDALVGSGNIECGYYNDEQNITCPDGTTKTAAANTFFSTVSQADANNQALASLAEECITVCNEAFNDLTWLAHSSCGPNWSASGAGATATGRVFPFQWACVEISSNSVFLPGTLDCDITITGSVSGSPLAGSVTVKVNGVVRFQTSGAQSFNETIHINGTDQNWQFTLEISQPGYAWDGTGSATLFLGS